MPPDILFDLDGTLIDSSPGILASFARVLAAHGLAPAVPLEASLIGPPLAVTLAQVSGVANEVLLARLVEAFKADYDSEGYRSTEVFPGVAEGLAQLAAAGHRLYIVTNKRMVPTRNILEALGLARHFAGIHTRDETEPPAPSKAAVTARALARHGIDPPRAVLSAIPTRTPPPRARTASPSFTPPTATARRASPAGRMRCLGISTNSTA